MENHVSPIRHNTFDGQNFAVRCHQLSSIVTYANVPTTISAHKTNEPLQETSQGQFGLLSQMWKKLKAMAYPCTCNPALRRGARNWAACVQASDALTATSRLHNTYLLCSSR